MEMNALQQFLEMPPPRKCVKILRMVISNLVQNPENPKFRSVLVEKVRTKFERENVSWDIVIELFVSLGFTRVPNENGRIEVVDFNLQAATTMLQLFDDFEQQQVAAKSVEVADDEVLRAMHTWDLPPQIEQQLSALTSQALAIWKERQDLIIEFYRSDSGTKLDNAIINTALVALIRNHVDSQLRNWDSQAFFLMVVPESRVEYLAGQLDDGRTGVQALIEETLSNNLNVECFQKAMYAHAQRGDNDIQRICSSAAGRKVALIQLVDKLLELFTTYYEKLGSKLLEESQRK